MTTCQPLRSSDRTDLAMASAFAYCSSSVPRWSSRVRALPPRAMTAVLLMTPYDNRRSCRIVDVGGGAMVDEMTARALRTAWQQAEQGLYGMGGGDVSRYELAVRLVRAVSDELGHVTSTAELMDQWPHAEELVHSASARSGLAIGALPVDQVAGAAFALRLTALRAQEARRA